jgi:signal transduction histidine kinase
MIMGTPFIPMPLIGVVCHALPAFIWIVITWDLCLYAYQRRPTSQFFRIAPIVASLMALHFLLHVIQELTPTELGGQLAGMHLGMGTVIELIALGSAATFRHMVLVMPVEEHRPSRTWLLTHYGIAAALGAVTLMLMLQPGGAPRALMLSGMYMVAVGGISIYRMRQLAQHGSWDPGGLQMRSIDVAFGLTALLGGGGLILLWMTTNGGPPTGAIDQVLFLFFHTAYGLGFALPFAVRMLARLVRIFFEASVMLMLAGLFVWVIQPSVAAIADDETRRLAEVAAVVVLTILFGSGRTLLTTIAQWKGTTWARRLPYWRHFQPMYALFQPSPRGELKGFLATLSPEAGIRHCCERAVTTLVDVMQLRGAAIVLLHERGGAQRGRVHTAPLEAAWHRLPAAQLPTRPFAGAELRELPLAVKQAFLNSDAVGVIPITSPRQPWGHLFIWTGFMETATSDAGVETLQAFADQLALVLDGAELLARVLGVERSLAHAEKLAAIGELAARFAHEIRNPVTAARSLAQQLAREPQDPYRGEHAVILTELERVERQVADLLRFARRDEFHFAPIELSALLRTVADELRPRCDAAGIGVDVTATDAVVARGDREKLRQVLINLVENAVDALSEAPQPRRLVLSVGRQNGAAHVEVRDNGTGVPPDALAHLFEPFFSLKSHGTGLGLSIAKRTVDAHGGRIAVSANGGTGLAFRIELPLDTAASTAT